MHKVKVSSKGQIAIPAKLRKHYDISKGDHLIIKESDEGFMILTMADQELLKLRGRFKDRNQKSMVKTLLEERKSERSKDK